MPAFPAHLSESEKTRIRSHMGYPGVRAAATFVMGFPATIETAYIIEQAMNEVRVEALEELRSILDVLDRLEDLDVEDIDIHVASAVGDITINHDEHRLIDSRYDRWLGKLENLLCCSRNPYDKRWAASGYGSINRPVMNG